MPAVAGRWRTDCTWDDVPHLDEGAKASMLASYPPHQRDARTAGIPALGSGAIWPIHPDNFTVDPFKLPEFWPRGYALDVGVRQTAALFAARDPDNDVIYCVSEYYPHDFSPPAVHAAAIQARGAWLPGCIDPSARNRTVRDGERLLEDYQASGLDLILAKNAVEAGILEVLDRISTGRLKVYRNLPNFFAEFRRYHRDEKGKVVKVNDHLMDCVRYICLNWIDYFMVMPRDLRTSVVSGPSSAIRRLSVG